MEKENLPEIATGGQNTDQLIKTVKINNLENLPVLADLTELTFDLMPNYWTPETPGETKLVFLLKIGMRDVIDQNTGEVLELECAHFIEQLADMSTVQISNASKRLVGALQSNNILPGTPLKITYKGKKKNKTNQFSSDNWSIKPLIINV